MKKIYFLSKKYVLVICLVVCFAIASVAQPTALGPGDIAFTGYISNTPNQVAAEDGFSFILLKAINNTTTINFTDNGWLSTGSFRSGEQNITWTATSNMVVGDEIFILGTTASTGTVSGTALSLNGPNGDQVLAFQGPTGAPTFISAITVNVYTIANFDPVNTTETDWDGTVSSQAATALPPGLTSGVNAIWTGVEGDISSEYPNIRFTCGPDVSSVALARAALNNKANWTTRDKTLNPTFTLPTNCTYAVSSAPVFTTQPTASTLCAGLAATFTAAASGSGITFTWQEANNAGFSSPTTLSNSGIYSISSTANSSTLTISNNTTVNGRYYRCVAANTGGTTNSNIVLLTANATTLPSGNPSTTINVGSGNASYAFASSCRLLARVVPGTVSGLVDVTSWLETVQPSNFVKRHYEITPQTNPGTSSATVTLYFTQQDFTDFNAVSAIKLPIDATDAANNKANLRIEKRPGTSSDGSGLPNTYTGTPVTLTPSSVTWNATASRWEVTLSVGSFSGFFAKVGSGVLPVTITSFTGKLNADKTATLQWKVAEQQGIQSYVVEESSDGSHYTAIGTVAASQLDNYSFTDPNLFTGKNYYRLKIVEQSGRSNYSSIVIINLKAGLTTAVYPNPVTDRLTIQQYGAIQKRTAVLTDGTGKVLQQVTITGQHVSIDMRTYPTGIYVLKMDDGSVFKVVKQ